MKKVLHYKTNYLNKSETFINRLVRNHRLFEPAVLCYRPRHFTENIRLFSCPDYGLQAALNTLAFHLNFSLPYFRRVVRRHKPHIVHAHFGYDAFKLLDISLDERIPLVTSFYGSDVSRLPEEFGWKTRYKKLAENGAHFIAASRQMKEELIKLGFPEDNISIIRFGLSLSKLTFNSNQKNPTRIMMAGRLVEKKGFEFGISAVSKLIHEGYPLELHIFGDGELEQHLKKISDDMRIAEHVHFYGYQPIDKIIEAHNRFGLMLAPSITASDNDMEGLPNTILEAMALGTVVISTRHAAIPEAIQHGVTGLLTDEKDIDGLAEQIRKVISNQIDTDRIKNNARKYVENHHSIETMVQQTEEIYQSILNRE